MTGNFTNLDRRERGKKILLQVSFFHSKALEPTNQQS